MSGSDWTPAFPGQRPPFEPGNQVAVRHGAFSKLRLEPRAAELVDEIRDLVPARSDADDPTIGLLALTFAQVEAATLYVAEHGIVDERGEARSILRHLGTMINTAGRLCDRLGLTPTSRAQLGLDLTRARGEALDAYLAEKRAAEERDAAA